MRLAEPLPEVGSSGGGPGLGVLIMPSVLEGPLKPTHGGVINLVGQMV